MHLQLQQYLLERKVFACVRCASALGDYKQIPWVQRLLSSCLMNHYPKASIGQLFYCSCACPSLANNEAHVQN